MNKTVNALLLAWLALGAGCGSGEDQATYSKDVKTIFEPCTNCHRPGGPAGPNTDNGFDILDPYASDDGLVGMKNLFWEEGSDYLEYLVVPGEPDQSFLMQKIADPALGLLGDDQGESMPVEFTEAPNMLTDGEKDAIERWISAGAEDTPQFRAEVVPIIGDDGRFNGKPRTGKCQLCHFAGTPNPPDLTDPFGPNGLVGVTATYRSDLQRVKPFDPEASFLVWKVRAEVPGSEQGAPMPRSYPRLTESQIEKVRQWILDGARP